MTVKQEDKSVKKRFFFPHCYSNMFQLTLSLLLNFSSYGFTGVTNGSYLLAPRSKSSCRVQLASQVKHSHWNESVTI